MDPSVPGQATGTLRDDHELTIRARAYGEGVVRGDRWPLSAIDLSTIEWATSTRMRRRHGQCSYGSDGGCTVTVSQRVYDRGGFEACREIVRHELVHVWQHQHRGERAWVTAEGVELHEEDGAEGDGEPGRRRSIDGDADADAASAGPGGDLEPPTDDGTLVRIEPGHGPSFRAWVDPLDLSGRCSSPYEKTRDDYRYVFECPACGEWWGRHRLCKRVRQAAHGDVGPVGYCYCTACEALVHIREGDRYLAHGDHSDEVIRAFADGECTSDGDDDSVSDGDGDGSGDGHCDCDQDVVVAVERLSPSWRPTGDG